MHPLSDIDLQREILLANLIDTMRTFATVRDTAEVWVADGLLCIYSGLPGAIFNSVVLTSVVATEEELRLKFDYVQALYRSRRARWSLWLLEYLVPDHLLAKLPEILNGYGSKLVSRGIGMYARQLSHVSRPLPKLQIERIESPASRFDFSYVMAVAFRTPLSTFLDVYNSVDYWQSPMQGFVAYSANRAVATVCIMPASGALGVYGVSVLPEVQKKGIGERAVRFALEQVSAQTGLKTYVLESSEIAVNFYRRLGFEPVTEVCIYNETR